MSQAAHLQRRRARALQHGGREPLDLAIRLIGALEASHAVEGGVPRDLHLDQR
jgi:hypothetical protein